MTLVVEGTKKLGEAECAIFKIDRVDGNGRPVTVREYCTVTDTGVLIHKDDSGDKPYPRIKFGTSAGRSWEWNHQGGLTKFKNLGEEEVKVPAGTYKALKVQSNGPLLAGGAMEATTTEWFAKGVGLVKMQSRILGYDGGLYLKKVN